MNRLARGLAAAALRWPRWLTAALRPPPAVAAAGLDPQLAAVLAVQHRAGLGGMDTLALPAARKLHDTGLAPLDAAPLPMREVIDVAGPPALRVYRPFGRPAAAGGGLLLYFHGGGGVMGSRDTHDGWCRFLAHHAGVQVVSVEYRLAPEHVHPAALEDALAAWRWTVANAARLGATRLAVGGDSFGGYLAAMIDQATSRPERHPAELPGAEGAPPPALQLLIYPLVDLTLSSPSIEAYGEGYLLTAALMRWFRAHYLGAADHEAARRRASPLLAPMLPRAAPALVVIGGFDPLHDETLAYARRLRDEARAAVEVLEHDELIHGFVVMTGAITRARAAGLQLCERLRAHLA